MLLLWSNGVWIAHFGLYDSLSERPWLQQAIPDRRPERYHPTLPWNGMVAVVLRGEPFRCRRKEDAGRPNTILDRLPCCSAAVRAQVTATSSLIKRVIEPLEAGRNKVEIVVTGGKCNLTDGKILSQLRKISGNLTTPRRGRVVRFVPHKDHLKQPESIRYALESLKSARPGGSEQVASIYDLILVLRHDTLWKRSIDQWRNANFSKFNFASLCEWRNKLSKDRNLCTNDVLHSMPGHFFPPFDATVGQGACFTAKVPHGFVCAPPMWNRVGRANVGFVTKWRPPVGVRDKSDIWEIYDAKGR